MPIQLDPSNSNLVISNNTKNITTTLFQHFHKRKNGSSSKSNTNNHLTNTIRAKRKTAIFCYTIIDLYSCKLIY